MNAIRHVVVSFWNCPRIALLSIVGWNVPSVIPALERGKTLILRLLVLTVLFCSQFPKNTQKTKYSQNPPVESHVGWVMSPHKPPSSSQQRPLSGPSSRYTHTTHTHSNNRPLPPHSPSTSPSAHSIPTFQHPSHSLLKANGFKQQQYHKYRHNCLKGTTNNNNKIIIIISFIIQNARDLELVSRRRWTLSSDSGPSF